MDDSAKKLNDLNPTVGAERPDPPPPGDIDHPKTAEATAEKVFATNAFPTQATPPEAVIGSTVEPPIELPGEDRTEDERADDE